MNILLQNSKLVIAVKSQGAELYSVVNKETQLEYMWDADPRVWGKSSPVLFPIVGTLKENTFRHKNKSYKLPRHGFARDRTFELEAHEKDSLIFKIAQDEASLLVYPFNFEFRLKYALDNDTLQVTYEVKNTGVEEMYFSVGGHPAFGVPLVKGATYEDHYLEFSDTETVNRWPINAEGLIEREPESLLKNNSRLNLRKTLFEKDALVLKELRSSLVSLKSDKHTHGLDFHFNGFPFLGIWAARNADFVCIEPWCGIADNVDHNQELATKEGIERLETDGLWMRTWSIKFY